MTEKIRNQKDSLARLMATENLTVVHKKIPTAYFDVKNRILACPTFKDDISNELYDLFMGHEVGHALNTPYEGLHSTIKENRTLKGYLNVVEDVRIEKAIKNKYAGLRRSFYIAYNELMERDFFGIKNRNLQSLSLIDKINLITKCGSRVNIKLTKEEQKFLDMAEDCKTWDDVVVCAEAIYEWSKENETRDETDEQVTIKMPDFDDEESDEEEDEYESMGGDESDDEPEDEDEDTNEEEGEVEDGEEESAEVEEIKTTGDKGGKFTGHYDDLEGARESITEHYAHNNEDMYVDENACVKTTIDLKKKFKETDIDAVLYPYKKVLSDWREYYSKDEDYETRQQTKDLSKQLGETYRKYLQSKNKKIVAHMAKEFEMRQNAHRSAKAFTGTSGDLDMNRLAKYQIVDDIFKRVTYLPDGKNHGVNVMVDWSGSINGEVKDILEQSIILAEFCTKVQIPFRVYLFSDSIVKSDDDEYYSRGEEKLVEVLSNEMKSREYIEMLNYLSTIMVGRWHSELRYAWDGSAKQRKIADEYNKCMGDINYFDCDDSNNYWNWKFDDNLEPYNYRLGGTPLDHTLVAMRKFLPEFNKKYNVEKSILTVITDGFSHSSDLLRQDDAERKDVKDQIGDEWRYNSQRYILDPYSNKTFIYEDKSGDNYYSRNDFENTQNILEWLSDTCNVTITGYFIFSTKRDWMNVADVLTKGTGMYYDEQSKMWNDMKKTGSVIKVKGYNKLFLTAASNLATTGEDELDDEFVGANKNRITAAFKRNQRGKTTSRFLTNEFIKEIA
tara:strand:+ start:57 stop:2411 length:2355 start_codon:yes stop_codon:yes gene_type:complete